MNNYDDDYDKEETLKDLIEEVNEYANDLLRSEVDGWFYDDEEQDPDNIWD